MSTILTVVGHYLPGYKAGGPVRSIAGLVEHLGSEFDFRILAADRDLGDQEPYPDVRPGEWQSVGKALVRYLAPEDHSLWAWRRLLRGLDYDLVYLNSYFLPLTVWTLLLRRVGQTRDVPVVLAPRGEFSRGALALKRWKKRPYIAFANAMGLCDGVVWHVSSEYERNDVQSMVRGAANVAVLPPVPIVTAPVSRQANDAMVSASVDKRPGALRVVYLSRVSPKKNLDLALRILRGIRGRVEFDIFGPLEDAAYWKRCRSLISDLPVNVRARYCGTVLPQQAIDVFSKYHALLFPTHGENYGHVILEALSAGCPVVISDQTPWRGLETERVGWDLPLGSVERFRAVLERCLLMDQDEFDGWSSAARDYARRVGAGLPALLQGYRELFRNLSGE